MYVVKPLSKSTLAGQAAREIKEEILAGHIKPGSALVESSLSQKLNISRGPLREAFKQLAEEGLITTIPYSGTFVTKLSLQDIKEIYSFRETIEIFAFTLVWDRRNDQFRDELYRRHDVLLEAIDMNNSSAAIEAELLLHSVVYECANHEILYKSWRGLSGRLQMYWSAHHAAHGRTGPRKESHSAFIEMALGDSLEAMHDKIRQHMSYGAKLTAAFLEGD